jgi:uncharacterized Fe-S cluster-containing radical SAM superfamily protein
MDQFNSSTSDEKTIDIDAVAAILRSKSIINNNQFLITNFSGSDQEKDFSEPANCQGFGRIHHFSFDHGKDWVPDPLPHHIAAWKLGLKIKKEERVQVFQNAACNCRCWYCFVDRKLLCASRFRSSFKTADQLVDLYLHENNRPHIIDLSGGQPDIIPEWTIRMMEALTKRGLEKHTYLWLDDNLTTYYAWKYLTPEDFDLMKKYKNFGRVGCFKGFSAKSFHENAGIPSEYFKRQIDIMSKWVKLGLDMYGYITLTTSDITELKPEISRFMDVIQKKIHPLFLLRIIPLKISVFNPTKKRMTNWMQIALSHQYDVLDAWNEELNNRYSKSERQTQIYSIKIK